jgi:DNA helicase-2/ATP-dependent DNA helicase PcrA
MPALSDQLTGDRLLVGLNDQQRLAVTTTQGPVLVVAGPGSGKTRVLTTRIAWLIEHDQVAPWNILALTFTNKASREMKERVVGLVGDRARWITMGTFHSFSARVLRQYGGEIGIDSRFVIYDDGDQLGAIKTVMQSLDINTKQFSPRSVLSGISSAKSRNIGSDSYGLAVETYWEEIVARVYPVYQETLRRRNALDFDDLLSMSLRLITESEHARDELRKRHRYILVDEYQDTNHLQYLIVNALSELHRNICVVGDPDQSIYGWRAADIRNILTFKDDYPDAVEIHLEENYRSTPQILQAADGVIRENTQRIDRALRTSRDSGTPIILRESIDEQHEARFVVEEILRLQSERGYSGRDFAILYRTNAQSRVIEEMLIRAGIPYQLIGGTRFYERKEIKDVLALLRLIVNPDDTTSFERVIDAFPLGQGIGQKTLATVEGWSRQQGVGLDEALNRLDQPSGPPVTGRGKTLLLSARDILADLRDMEPAMSLIDFFDYALDTTGYRPLYTAGDPEMAERWENVLQLRAILEPYEAIDGEDRLTTFLEEVALVSDADTIEDDQARVTLITLHAVKGLEFPVVFITGVEEGLIPHQRSIMENPAMLEEERRLFYVGITRAKDQLYLTHAFRRSRFGMTDLSIPSSFLEAIPDNVLGDRPTRPAEPRRVSVLTAAQPTPELPPLQHFETGQRVFHQRFGDGVILRAQEKDGDQELDIEFVRNGRKRLIASLANLTTD